MSKAQPSHLVQTLSQLFSGLRFRLVVLVVLASLPPVALTLCIARQDRQSAVAALRQRSQAITRLSARRRLQVLSRRLVEVQETERRHLARELHAWFPLKWAHPPVLLGAV